MMTGPSQQNSPRWRALQNLSNKPAQMIVKQENFQMKNSQYKEFKLPSINNSNRDISPLFITPNKKLNLKLTSKSNESKPLENKELGDIVKHLNQRSPRRIVAKLEQLGHFKNDIKKPVQVVRYVSKNFTKKESPVQPEQQGQGWVVRKSKQQETIVEYVKRL